VVILVAAAAVELRGNESMSRDTDLDWQNIGATEPWYGVLATEKFLKANLTASAIEDFYEQGVREIREVAEIIKRHFGAFKPSFGLDFGCGLGRLAFAMAPYCERVIGLDISPAMLAEGEKQRVARGVANVQLLHELPDGQFADWINSYIVLQHITPKVGLILIENLLRRLNLGGYISLQLTYFHDVMDTGIMRDFAAYTFDGEQIKVLAETAPQVGLMSMYDYDLNRVFRLLYKYGLNDTHIVQTDHGGCHGMWLFGVKQR
jgi:SAM-dependent methyltransferase